MKVGILAGGSFLILFALVFLLTSSKGILTRNAILRTYMDDASGLAEGTPVRLNGITIGYLDKLQLTGSREPRRAVEFDMKVKRRFLEQIPVDSVAGIAASNLLGDKFIDITKGRSPEHVRPDAEILSLQAQDIPELMAQTANLMVGFQGIVARLDKLLAGVENGQGNLGLFVKDRQLYDRLNDIASEGQKLLSDVRDGQGTVSKLLYDPTLYNEIRAPLNRINAILADIDAGKGTAGKLVKDPALYDEAKQTMTEIHGLVSDINAGKGTAGKLAKDDQLYTRLNDLSAKLNATLDKINSGQGTMGQLMTNAALFDSLNGAVGQLQGLVQDVRKNPKKFLTLRLALF
ncbi:MAG TPA: MlaD family protein [Bryobacteraceae bacterium]|nr:MlaD family protein [Bryobacteraceae bacterium]